MAHCLIVVMIWAIIVVLVLALVETLIRYLWPPAPWIVFTLLRILAVVIIVLWVVTCLGGLPGPPALPR